MEERKGPKSGLAGASVTIEDCWIGPRAVVLPGVTIRRGDPVEAGVTVRESSTEQYQCRKSQFGGCSQNRILEIAISGSLLQLWGGHVTLDAAA